MWFRCLGVASGDVEKHAAAGTPRPRTQGGDAPPPGGATTPTLREPPYPAARVAAASPQTGAAPPAPARPTGAARAGASARRVLRSRDAAWVAGLTLLALAIRVVWVLAIDRTNPAFGDESYYQIVGQSLADGDGYSFFGEPTVQWPPAYPVLLAGVFLVFGLDLVAAQLVNALLGALVVPLIYLAARRTFGRVEAIVAGALVAVMAGPIFFTEMLMSETLYTLLVTAVVTLVACLRPTWRAAVAIGVVIALASLTRGEGFFLPLIPIVVWWGQSAAISRAATSRCASPCSRPPRRSWSSPGWPATRASRVRSGRVAAQGGQTLWDGHNPTATGAAGFPRQELLERSVKPGQTQAEREVARASLLRDEAIAWAVSHPLQELTLIPRKLLYANRSDGYTLGRWINNPRVLDQATVDKLAVWADVTWYGTFALAVFSLVLFGRGLWRVAADARRPRDARARGRALRRRLLRQQPLPRPARAARRARRGAARRARVDPARGAAGRRGLTARAGASTRPRHPGQHGVPISPPPKSLPQ